jgi:hypothetical protein
MNVCRLRSEIGPKSFCLPIAVPIEPDEAHEELTHSSHPFAIATGLTPRRHVQSKSAQALGSGCPAAEETLYFN